MTKYKKLKLTDEDINRKRDTIPCVDPTENILMPTISGICIVFVCMVTAIVYFSVNTI